MYDLLCIDERDSPNLTELKNKTRKEIKQIKNRRHFGICGVIIPGEKYAKLNMSGRKIQEKCLGIGKYLPFHYVDILNNKNEFAFLGTDNAKRVTLISSLNNIVKSTDYKIVSCFIDKGNLALEYGIFPNNKLEKIRKIKPNMSRNTTPKKINLYEIALKHVIQDFFNYLKDNGRKGLIIAEARGKKEDKALLDSFYHYQKLGAGSLSGSSIRKYIVDLLIIHKSQNHVGTQLADLVTYPLYDSFVDDHNKRNDHFIKAKNYEDKIISVKIFPNKKGA